VIKETANKNLSFNQILCLVTSENLCSELDPGVLKRCCLWTT